jgi:hypothetical protein
MPRRVDRRQQDDLPNQVKGTATFTLDTNTSGYITPHTGYYIANRNLEIPVELLNVNGAIHWYALSYNRQTSYYETDEDDKYPIDNILLGYFDITNPRHINYITPDTFHKPAPYKEFAAGGLHHITTLERPQAQLSETHPILPYIEQAATQGEEIPVDTQPIASTSQVIIQPAMANFVQINTQLFGQQGAP